MKIKNIIAGVLTTIVGGCRLIASSGSSVFYTFGLLKFIGKENTQAALPLAYTAASANAIVTLALSVPTTYTQLSRALAKLSRQNPDSSRSSAGLHDSEEIERIAEDDLQDLEQAIKPKTPNSCSRADLAIRAPLDFISVLSGSFSSLSMAFGAIVSAEFWLKQVFDTDIHDEKWKEQAVFAFAITCAISQLVYFACFRLSISDQNAKELAATCTQKPIDPEQEHKKQGCNKTLIATATIATPGLISSAVLAFFSTVQALQKTGVPASKTLLLTAIGTTSVIASTVSALMTDLRSLYRFLSPKEKESAGNPNNSPILVLPRYEPLLKMLILTSGLFDVAINKGFSLRQAVPFTLQKLDKSIDPHGEVATTLAWLCLLSSTLLAYGFNVNEGYKNLLKLCFSMEQQNSSASVSIAPPSYIIAEEVLVQPQPKSAAEEKQPESSHDAMGFFRSRTRASDYHLRPYYNSIDEEVFTRTRSDSTVERRKEQKHRTKHKTHYLDPKLAPTLSFLNP